MAPKMILPSYDAAHNDGRVLDPNTVRELENLFLMDGITPYAAAKIVGCMYPTAVRYFDEWAENLIASPDYETWAYRQKRVRARALEGITKKIMFVTQQRKDLERIVGNLMYEKKKDKETKLEKLELLDPRYMNHPVILGYQGRITTLTQQLMELQSEYDAIDAAPPAEVILKKEIGQLINETAKSQ